MVDTFDLMDLVGMLILMGLVTLLAIAASVFMYFLAAVWLGLTSLTWFYSKPQGRDSCVDRFILILRDLPLLARRVLLACAPLTLSMILLVAAHQVFMHYKRILDFHLIERSFVKAQLERL